MRVFRKANFIAAVFSLLVLLPAHASDFPEPEGAVCKSTNSTSLGGTAVESRVYESSDSLGKISSFYKTYFNKEGFDSVAWKNSEAMVEKNSLNLITKESMRYEKLDTVYSVTVADKDNKREITVAKHLRSTGAGEFSPESVKWDELIKLMPKEDVPGADLDIVPRPPQSVRLSSRIFGQIAMLSYSSEMTIDAISDFYHKAMGDYGWREAGIKDFDKVLAEGKRNHADPHAERSLDNSFIGMQFGALSKGSKILYFNCPKGSVDVTLMNMEPSNPKGKVCVMVYYVESKKVTKNGKK